VCYLTRLSIAKFAQLTVRNVRNSSGKDTQGIGWEDVGWVDLAQERNKWRDVVKTVMNLQIP
jgi:hypothetical protein